jgi:hypothetical protein
MPASRPARLALPGAAAVILACAALTGCGGSGPAANPANAAPSTGSSSPAGHAAASGGKLTGNFCTDFGNIGANIQIPANAQGSVSALRQHGAPYLEKVASYFDGLAAEASPQAGQELRALAADYRAIAQSISSGTAESLSRLEGQIVSLTTRGVAGSKFRQLLSYVAAKCG